MSPSANTSTLRLSSNRTHRILFGIVLAFAAVTIVLTVLYFVLAFQWRSRPFFGTMLTHTMVVNNGMPTGTETWAGLEAGLQFKDEILSINDVAIPHDNYPLARQRYTDLMATLSPGDPITVQFIRSNLLENTALDACESTDGTAALCSVSYRLQPLPDGDFLAFFLLPFVSGVIVLAIGLVVLYLRSNQTVALLAASICFLGSLFAVGIFDVGSTHTLIPAWLIAMTILSGALVTFGIVFPLPLRATFRYPLIRAIPFVATALLASFVLFSHLNVQSPQDYGMPTQVAGLTMIGGIVLYAILIAVFQRPQATTLVARDQSNTLFIGIGLILFPSTLWLIGQILQQIDSQIVFPLNIESTAPFFITTSLAIAYSVLQYRRIDTDRIISQGITYSIMLGVLIVGYFLMVTGASFITQDVIQANNPLMVALTIFGISLLFIPVRTRLQRRIDELYFRVRRNYQRHVEEFGQALTKMDNRDEIIQTFRTLLQKTITPANIFVFLPGHQHGIFTAAGSSKNTSVSFMPDSEIIQLMAGRDDALVLTQGQPWPHELRTESARLKILKPMVLAPLSGTESLIGFVILGAPQASKAVYDYEELRFLYNAMSQLAIAVERASVIDSLQQSVEELNVLSQVAQAVNFTIEFDDLLELISAQTHRLIETPCFYIALHDPTIDQLYFAFFQEDDERYPEKENIRWNMGNDPFSEIVRTRESLKFDNYSEEMANRKTTTAYQVTDLKAWMGIPLVAGTRTLGALAVGKTKSKETYTQDQFTMLDKIVSLAATSLDKARLFNETNMRARQLSALNDISRQIAAAELDVEPLLEIITTSAVEILNTEAGTLFLNTEDLEPELEFKVVIGGAEDLLGQRLKQGQGVVGQVALTAEPAIVNDVDHNPFHTDVSEEFDTNSLLAVPLIAKENVIGVLEVLNKSDGTIFVNEDVELLTTFARQAAIAIENARLFEMTDRQLARRVEELEILERIDHELNRTLDLNEVARITVAAAAENCSATAGAMGVVVGAPPYLQIVALQGYSDLDYPEGADGMEWPVEYGIVKRVMNNRQPDLVTDTSIDPDYKPSLQGANSQITIPMLSGDEINAILILEKVDAPSFSLPDWAFAQRLAEHASIAIANAQLYAELTRANKTKSEFMGFAAHELKNPLTSVMGFADIVGKGSVGPLNESQEQMLNVIHSNAKRMETIIEDLRDSAKMEAEEFTVHISPIDVRNVVVETLRPFQQQLEEKNQQVVTELPEDLPLVMGDQNRLIQVLTNLVSNAYKYSPPESTIIIDGSIVEEYRNRKGQLLGQMIQVSVADNGIGMSEEDLAKLFNEKYFRSDNPDAREQPGTGLGMMITQGIIKQHGGEIRVDSKIGEGSIFSFVLPIATETEQQEMQLQTEPASD